MCHVIYIYYFNLQNYPTRCDYLQLTDEDLSLRDVKELSTVHSVNKWWCQGLSSEPELFPLKYMTYIFVHLNKYRDYLHAQCCCLVERIIRISEEGKWSATWGG